MGSGLMPLTYDKSTPLLSLRVSGFGGKGVASLFLGLRPRRGFSKPRLFLRYSCRSLGIGGLAWDAPGVDYSIAQMLSRWRTKGPRQWWKTTVLRNKRVSVRARAKLSCATERLAKPEASSIAIRIRQRASM